MLVRLRKLRWLLVAWVTALVVPAVVVDLALHPSLNGTLGGAIFGIWILGYLLQFGVFMAVMRTADSQNFLAWLVASLLPWVFDWLTPALRWGFAPCVAVAVGTALYLYRKTDRRDALEHQGIRATGTVLEVVKPKLFNVVINNVYIRRTLRLRVQRADGAAAYEARLSGLFMLGEIPDVGDRMSLRIDPKDPQHLTSVDESAAGQEAPAAQSGRLPGGASNSASRFRMQHHLRDQPDVAAAPDSQGDDIAGALDKLARLHQAGSLTDAEFEQAKARILND